MVDSVDSLDNSMIETQYRENIKSLWQICQDKMSQLHQEAQEAIEQIIEESATEKFERIAEENAQFALFTKKLDHKTKKDLIQQLKVKRDLKISEIKEESESTKRANIEETKL